MHTTEIFCILVICSFLQSWNKIRLGSPAQKSTASFISDECPIVARIIGQIDVNFDRSRDFQLFKAAFSSLRKGQK